MNLQKRLAKCKQYLYNDPAFVGLIDLESSYDRDLKNFKTHYGDLFFTYAELQYFTCGAMGRWGKSNSPNENENKFFSLGREYFESKK
jgi:hypothetical protein